jgi:GTP cyclohydrolase I
MTRKVEEPYERIGHCAGCGRDEVKLDLTAPNRYRCAHCRGEDPREDLVRALITHIGDNPARDGLLETPKRFLAAWREWARGYDIEPAELLKTFADGAERVNELVLVRDIPVYSVCEHHLVPMFGVAHIGYIPNGRIVGLSKLARVADAYARRLQVQERLTNQIADLLQQELLPMGVGVVVELRHLCMETRGIRAHGSTTTTSALRGVLFDKPEARAEFFSLVRSK